MTHDERRPLRSQSWWDAGALDLIGHRSQFRMQGFPEEAFTRRPVIGILNSWSEVAGCNAHLRELADHVKRGVLSAGGFPVEVPVISRGERRRPRPHGDGRADAQWTVPQRARWRVHRLLAPA